MKKDLAVSQQIFAVRILLVFPQRDQGHLGSDYYIMGKKGYSNFSRGITLKSVMILTLGTKYHHIPLIRLIIFGDLGLVWLT